MTASPLVPAERVARSILVIRGQKVLLDEHLAALYGVSTKRLNEQIRRNVERFPDDFAFRLTPEEAASLRSQIATSNGRGGRRYAPLVFTEHGVVAAAFVLNSAAAVQVSVQVVRAFVRMREFLATQEEHARRLGLLERRTNVHETDLRSLSAAFRKTIEAPPPPTTRRRIGVDAGESPRDRSGPASRARPRARRSPR